MIGYGVFAGCVLILAAVCLYTRKKIDNIFDRDSMIYGGGNAGSLTLTCSVFAAWMWTTSVFGSAETYALYGVWGPVSYVAGACIAFAGLIAFLAYLRTRFSGAVTWIGFIRRRYGRTSRAFYYLFAVVVPAYVLIEQGVGIAYVLETFYGSSFKIISFLCVLMAAGFVFFGGMKAVLFWERIAAAVILAGFLAGVIFVAAGEGIGEGLPETAASAASVASVAESSAGGAAGSALRYFIMAIVIAFGQIVFDPAYNLKADLAESRGRMVLAFSIGGILLWGSVTLASSLFMGRMAATAGSEVTDLFHGPAKAVFSLVIIFIGISTISHYMIGLFGIFSLDLYDTVSQREGSDRNRIIFGRILLAAVGLFCASMTIALENISLLTIDVFCAIFFAAPCVPLLMGCLSRRNFGRLPVLSVVIGIIGGLIVWVVAPGTALQNQFAGMGASLLIPLALMMGGYMKKMPYDG